MVKSEFNEDEGKDDMQGEPDTVQEEFELND